MMTLQQLHDLVEVCTKRGISPFYRKLYGMSAHEPAKNITTWDDWRSLPVFAKEHLTGQTLPGRVFHPWHNIDTILASSGTSGNPPVYSSWTLNDGYGHRLQYHDFKRATLSSMPTPYQQDWILRKNGCAGRLIILDPRRHTASVRLAQTMGVDSMFLILHHLPMIAEEMVRLRVSENIRFIEIAGETCSRSLFLYIRKMFPNAIIAPIYGSSDVETSPIGIPCRPMTGEEPLEVYHEGERTYLEVIDPETGTPVPVKNGVEGDLVITSYAGATATFPLIRYKIGDTVRVVEAPCKKHGTWSFAVLGRTQMDFLKVPGGILRADAVERTLRILGDAVSDRFELHRYERDTSTGMKVEVVLYVEVPENTDMGMLARNISKELYVGASYTYEDGVREGLYLPLTCVPLSESPSKTGKRIRMIQH